MRACVRESVSHARRPWHRQKRVRHRDNYILLFTFRITVVLSTGRPMRGQLDTQHERVTCPRSQEETRGHQRPSAQPSPVTCPVLGVTRRISNTQPLHSGSTRATGWLCGPGSGWCRERVSGAVFGSKLRPFTAHPPPSHNAGSTVRATGDLEGRIFSHKSRKRWRAWHS